MKLIEELKERLYVTCSQEEIMEYYKHMNYNQVVFWWKNLEEANRIEKAPAISRKVYFPWIDVIASMYLMPEKVIVTEKKCPSCGGRVISLYFKSPSWTWTDMCGRAGRMEICMDCPQQLHFDLEIMN